MQPKVEAKVKVGNNLTITYFYDSSVDAHLLQKLKEYGLDIEAVPTDPLFTLTPICNDDMKEVVIEQGEDGMLIVKQRTDDGKLVCASARPL